MANLESLGEIVFSLDEDIILLEWPDVYYRVLYDFVSSMQTNL